VAEFESTGVAARAKACRNRRRPNGQCRSPRQVPDLQGDQIVREEILTEAVIKIGKLASSICGLTTSPCRACTPCSK